MNLRKKIFGGTAFALTLAFSLTMVFVGTAVADENTGTEDKSNLTYYTAKLFDYEQSNRDAQTGEFYNGQYDGDVALTSKTDEGLILFNQDNEKPQIGAVPGAQNSWEKACKYKVFQGIAADEFVDGKFVINDEYKVVSDNKIITLFDEESDEYVGSYNFPFEKDENGYLRFDSSKNHLKLTDTLDENGNYAMERKDYASTVGFMPFNDALVGKSGSVYIPGTKNFYFGMTVTVPFVMTVDGKIENVDGQREDMTFEFSGEDDIWVFIDGKLVLDLGGVHDSVDGTINFATKEVTTVGNHMMDNGEFSSSIVGDDKNVKETVTITSEVLSDLEKGAHTMTVYYLERGGSVSNCKMTFRLEDEEPEVPEEDPEEPKEDPEEPEEDPEEPEEDPEEPKEDPEEIVEVVVPGTEKDPQPIISEDVVPEKEPEEPKTPEEPKEPEEPKKPEEPEKPEQPEEPENPTIIIEDEEVPLIDGGSEDTPDEEILPQTGTSSPFVFYAIGMLLMVSGFGLVRYARKAI